MPGDSDGDLTIPIRVDDRFDVYASFFDHAWARRIRELARGSKLDEPTFSLCMNWKAIANTYRFPWFMIECLKWQMQGFLKKHEPLSVAVTTAIESRLLEVMRGDLSEAARRKLRDAVREIAEAASSARDDSDAMWSSTNVHWHELLPDQEFAISIWGSQRICYAALYHTFEDFARQCIGLASGQGQDWRPGGEIIDAATRLFGESFVQACLCDHAVTVARLVRNALAHHGGRVTKELGSVAHGLEVENGVIQILADDTSKLFHALKNRAYDLAAETLKLPAMQSRV